VKTETINRYIYFNPAAWERICSGVYQSKNRYSLANWIAHGYQLTKDDEGLFVWSCSSSGINGLQFFTIENTPEKLTNRINRANQEWWLPISDGMSEAACEYLAEKIRHGWILTKLANGDVKVESNPRHTEEPYYRYAVSRPKGVSHMIVSSDGTVTSVRGV